MLGKYLLSGAMEHALRSRQLQEDDIMTACIANSGPGVVLMLLTVHASHRGHGGCFSQGDDNTVKMWKYPIRCLR